MLVYEGKLKDGNKLWVEAVAAGTFRVRIADEWEKESGMNRYGFILEQPAPEYAAEERDGLLTLRTAKAELSVSLEDGKVALRNAAGETILSSVAAPQNNRQGFKADFGLKSQTRIYGLGDVTRERIEKTGFATEIWIENVKQYIPIPFMLSTAGWGLYLNCTWRHTVDVGSSEPGMLRLSAAGGGLDYYLFVGDGVEEILNEYTNLLGKPVMLPIWAYGLVYVCNQRVNDYEMMQECLNFRREGIPCDVCGLEPGWMSKNYDYSTKKDWNPEKFYVPYWTPDGGDATYFGAMNRLGFKLSLWLCCDYDLSFEEERQAAKKRQLKRQSEAQTQNADDFEQDRHFAAGSLHMDRITNPDEPWFEHLKKFVRQGASCFKLDGADQIMPHPDRKWGNGMDDEEMHNLYPLILDKQMSRGFADYTGRRSMIYSASGYAGLQRFVANWAGDTGGGPKPLVHMLNHGYSGHVNTSCDMDVFSDAGIHFGFFQPWSQLCNWAYWRQPWFLPPARKEMYRFYAKLRYRMLPYIYTLAHRAAKTGYPIMRAMSMAYPDMPGVDEMLYQYMFGDDMLTAAFAEQITLPEGRWINAWTNEYLDGGKTIPVEYPETVGGPLYLRDGAFIPTCEPGEFIGQKPIEEIGLNLYPAMGTREYELYEDDGLTEKYLSGEYATTRMSVTRGAEEIVVRICPRVGAYDGMPEKRRYRINVMNLRTAAGAWVNGVRVEPAVRTDGWCATIAEGFVSVAAEENGEEIVVTIRL